MTDPNYQHDILIIDRSYSIAKILEGMQDGLREFIGSQEALVAAQDLASVTASLWQFDDKLDCVGSFEPVTRFSSYEIVPRGNTALCDAVGIAVTAEGEKLAAMPEDARPRQVVVIIASDGLENCSVQWNGPRVRSLLEMQQRDYGWQVVYLGTNQDAFRESGRLGVPGMSTMDYHGSSAGAQSAWKSTAQAVSRFSRGGPGGQSVNSVSYTDAERAAARTGDEEEPGE